MVTTPAVRPRSAGVTKGEEEDEETDKLGEEGAEDLEEHGLQEFGERGENTGGGSASRIHWRPCSGGSSAPYEPRKSGSRGLQASFVKPANSVLLSQLFQSSKLIMGFATYRLNQPRANAVKII